MSNRRKSINGLEFKTENKVWELRPDHRVYRQTLFQLVSKHMYVVGDYYVPADELFFGTKVLADDVLEYIIDLFFKDGAKEIEIFTPRYEKQEGTNNVGDYVELPTYLEKYSDSKVFFEGEIKVAISSNANLIRLAVWNK